MKVYLDHAATTPLHPKVLERMLPFLKEDFGNPSSLHSFGRKAKVAIEEARETIASFINADAGEIFFTSGGTESNNFALRGIASAEKEESKRDKIITGKQEHACVKDTIKELSKEGFIVDFMPPLSNSLTDTGSIRDLIDERVSVISLIHTNNETGAVNDISSLAIKDYGKKIYIHSDTVQSFGKTEIDVVKLGADSITASAHKINGPKGIGFTYIKRGTPATPILRGGAQERNRRGGTENVAGIVGFAEAVRIAKEEMLPNYDIVTSLKNTMSAGISSIDSKGLVINSGAGFSPYILSLTFDSRFYNNDPEAMLIFLDINGIAASNGAACSSGALRPSHVILSMGKSLEDARGTVRFSFSAGNRMEEIEYTLDILKKMSLKFRK